MSEIQNSQIQNSNHKIKSPYQPPLLRIIHGINGLLIIGAIITGFLVYDSFICCYFW